jgi:hypothetical protein
MEAGERVTVKRPCAASTTAHLIEKYAVCDVEESTFDALHVGNSVEACRESFRLSPMASSPCRHLGAPEPIVRQDLAVLLEPMPALAGQDDGIPARRAAPYARDKS